MKKLLCMILSVVLVFALCACGTEETNSNTNDILPIEEYQETEVVSLDEAIKIFKEDHYASVEGYDFYDNGWLSKGFESIGYIHLVGVDVPENVNYFLESRNSIYTFDGKELIEYSFGDIIGRITIDSEAIYCGISEMTGFIFRKGDTVYSVDFDLTEQKTIATGVKFVIDTDYAHNSDGWSQPLFLMEDGSVKAYIRWEEELVGPIYEGGYGGTFIE